MGKNIRDDELHAVADFLRKDKPGWVYILDEQQDENYVRQGVYFSLGRALAEGRCRCCADKGKFSFRLEVNEPKQDGTTRFIGIFFLRYHPDGEFDLADAILGHEAMKDVLGREPEYLDISTQEICEQEEVRVLEYQLTEELKCFLPFEEFASDAPGFAQPIKDFGFEPAAFCQMIDEVNRYFLAIDQVIKSDSLPIMEGLTQIASCPECGNIVFETAKAAAGGLLHHLKEQTLEADRLVFPALGQELSEQQEVCRQALCLNLRDRDLRPFSRYMQVFAEELPEVKMDGLSVCYRFDPFV